MSDYNMNEFECFNPNTEKDVYPAVGHQYISVCLPVEITPFAKVGTASVNCKGDAVVKPGCTPCSGTKNGTCAFTISQTLCVEVPVFFGASTYVGDTYVDCLGDDKDGSCECNSYCRGMEESEEE